MRLFSKFGAWDNEIKALIDKLSTETKLSIEQLNDWFYGEGLLAWQKAQATSYANYVKIFQDKEGHRPTVPAEYMAMQIAIAAVALLDEMVKYFFIKDNNLKEILGTLMGQFILSTNAKHGSFHIIQSEIMTNLNRFLDQNPNIPRNELHKLVINEFLGYKEKQPALAEEIDNHIQLMNEFLDVMNKRTNPSITKNSPVLFRAQQGKEHVGVENKTASLESAIPRANI